MSSSASIPKALYQANIDLALRIAALLQENGKQWFDLFAEEASARFEEGFTQTARLDHGLSLEQLSALPADVATQFFQLDASRWQALLTHAVENQTHFAQGVQAALNQWQAACSDAFDALSTGAAAEVPGGLSVLPGLTEMAASIRRFMAQAIPDTDPPFAKPAAAAAKAKAGKGETDKGEVDKGEAKGRADKPATDAAKTPVGKKSAAKKAAAKQAQAKPAAAKPAKPAPAKPAPAKSASAKAATGKKSAAKKAIPPMAAPLAPSLAPKPLPAVVTRGPSRKQS